MSPQAHPALTVALIQQVVADHYAIPVERLRGQRRHTRFARPRHVAMYLAAQLLPLRSFPTLGRQFGRDHTTVMYAVKRVGERIETDSDLARDVSLLTGAIKAAARPDIVRETAECLAEDIAFGLRRAMLDMAAADPSAFIRRLAVAFGQPERARNQVEEDAPCAG